jgi:hypothetical protein
VKCRIAGCTDLVKAKGLYNRHYLKLRRYGDPEATARRPARATTATSVGPQLVEGAGEGAPGLAVPARSARGQSELGE